MAKLKSELEVTCPCCKSALVIDTIQHLFQLRECEGPIVPDESFLPCLYHQIDRCAAPCATSRTVPWR